MDSSTLVFPLSTTPDIETFLAPPYLPTRTTLSPHYNDIFISAAFLTHCTMRAGVGYSVVSSFCWDNFDSRNRVLQYNGLLSEIYIQYNSNMHRVGNEMRIVGLGRCVYNAHPWV